MSKYDDLKDLDELRRSGAITEEEYQQEKEKILHRWYESGNNKPLLGLEENSYLALMHISQLAGYILVGLGFLIPVILWLINKDYSEKIDATGKGIINFMLSWLIYAAVAGVLCLLLIGIPILIILGALQVAFVIIAAIKANNGEVWEYPFTIRILG
ncbi:hypothetical protein FACS189426_00840 [Bacteroidia bacterium]|nr:hypothetical protein FACS189426_00840 [Bacteroidia bacterium]